MGSTQGLMTAIVVSELRAQGVLTIGWRRAVAGIVFLGGAAAIVAVALRDVLARTDPTILQLALASVGGIGLMAGNAVAGATLAETGAEAMRSRLVHLPVTRGQHSALLLGTGLARSALLALGLVGLVIFVFWPFMPTSHRVPALLTALLMPTLPVVVAGWATRRSAPFSPMWVLVPMLAITGVVIAGPVDVPETARALVSLLAVPARALVGDVEPATSLLFAVSWGALALFGAHLSAGRGRPTAERRPLWSRLPSRPANPRGELGSAIELVVSTLSTARLVFGGIVAVIMVAVGSHALAGGTPQILAVAVVVSSATVVSAAAAAIVGPRPPHLRRLIPSLPLGETIVRKAETIAIGVVGTVLVGVCCGMTVIVTDVTILAPVSQLALPFVVGAIVTRLRVVDGRMGRVVLTFVAVQVLVARLVMTVVAVAVLGPAVLILCPVIDLALGALVLWAPGIGVER